MNGISVSQTHVGIVRCHNTYKRNHRTILTTCEVRQIADAYIFILISFLLMLGPYFTFFFPLFPVAQA